MPIELIKEKCTRPINVVEIGSPARQSVKIGGQTGMPFLFDEGQTPNPPVVALEVLDCRPDDWPEGLTEPFGRSIESPGAWARACVDKFGAKMVCVHLQGIHPDWGSKNADDAIGAVKEVRDAVPVPLIITGCGDDDRDNDVLPKVSQALKGENCLFGLATQSNYKTLAATCLADGHSVIAESPIDVNIAKQINILISDMGFDSKRIVMHPTTTSLGYGMEYVYSIMERSRLAAFIGDHMLAMPFILFIGQETWKVKEAKEDLRQASNWELVTAVSLLQAGGDIVVMRHPDAARSAMKYVQTLMAGGAL